MLSDGGCEKLKKLNKNTWWLFNVGVLSSLVMIIHYCSNKEMKASFIGGF